MNISEQITSVINGRPINEIPIEIRNRVERGIKIRLDRHAGHSTTHNPDRTVTVTNDRITVTLPESEFKGRQHTFTTSMRVLGHRSELRIPTPEPTTDEIYAVAFEFLAYEYLVENCRYNLAETIMRLNGGHRMSEGMQSDVSAAQSLARVELRENPAPYMAEAKRILHQKIEMDRQYHAMISGWCQNWKIEVTGTMPTQIGLCDYREEI
jgi:hypothetical protein